MKTQVTRYAYNEYMVHQYAFAMKVAAKQEPERPSLYHRLEGENRPNHNRPNRGKEIRGEPRRHNKAVKNHTTKPRRTAQLGREEPRTKAAQGSREEPRRGAAQRRREEEPRNEDAKKAAQRREESRKPQRCRRSRRKPNWTLDASHLSLRGRVEISSSTSLI